jgi:hypothetical protein
VRRLTQEEVEREIAALDAMDSRALRQRWRDLYGTEPPPKIQSGLLRLAVAYRIQEKTFGGLKQSTKRKLESYASLAADRRREGTKAIGRITPTLNPGTQLLREWNGTTVLVDVVEDGFRWKDRTYRTLSAVAVAITGTKWSGPKFFGLTPKVSTKRHEARAS